MVFNIKNLFIATVLVALFMAFPETAMAHKVSVFAWVEGDTVYTLGKFSGGKKVKNGRIEVYDTEGKKLLDGLTNERGEFAFKIPQKTVTKVHDSFSGASSWFTAVKSAPGV